jgi:hypothetical protein
MRTSEKPSPFTSPRFATEYPNQAFASFDMMVVAGAVRSPLADPR